MATNPPSITVHMPCVTFAILSGFAAAQGCTLEEIVEAIFSEEANRIKIEESAD